MAHPAEQQNTRAHQPDHVRGAKAQMTEQRDRINSSTIKKQGRHTKSKRHLFCKMEISGKELSVEIQVFMTSEPFLSYPVSILPAIIWKYLLLNQTSSSSHLTLASLEVRGWHTVWAQHSSDDYVSQRAKKWKLLTIWSNWKGGRN